MEIAVALRVQYDFCRVKKEAEKNPENSGLSKINRVNQSSELHQWHINGENLVFINSAFIVSSCLLTEGLPPCQAGGLQQRGIMCTQAPKMSSLFCWVYV